MRPIYKIDIISAGMIRQLFMPTLLIGGLVVAVVGGYHTEAGKARCRQVAKEHGYVESYYMNGRRGGADVCVCRGRVAEDGSIDRTVSESIPLE